MPRKSLADKAYHLIKEWIIEYRLKPGSHLSIQELAEALGTSRTPVREALSRLEQEYLVARTPMKGFAVNTLDLKEIEDLFEVRQAIELLAVRNAAKRINPEIKKQLAESLASTAQWIKKGEKLNILNLEQNFHMKILEASGNISLVEIGRGILQRIWSIQRFNIVTSNALTDAHIQHTELFHVLSEGNPKKAEAMMRKHMKHTSRMLITRLRNQQDILHNTIAFNPREWDGIDRGMMNG